MLKTKKSSKIRYVVFISIGCAIIIAMVWKIGIRNLYDSLSTSNPYLLLCAFIVTILAITIKLARWANLFRDTTIGNASKVYLISQGVNQIAPTGSGELMRAYIAKSKLNIPVGKTLAPAVIERIADTTFLVAILVLCLTMLTYKNTYILQVTIPIFLLLIAYLIVLKPRFIDKFAMIFEHLSKKKGFVGKISNPVSGALNTFKESLLLFHKKKAILVQTILLTTIAWSINALPLWILLLGTTVEVSLLYIFVISCASEIIGAFSFLPGGLGAKEVSFAILLSALGIPFDIGMYVSLISRGINYILLGSGALVSLISFTMTSSQP